MKPTRLSSSACGRLRSFASAHSPPLGIGASKAPDGARPQRRLLALAARGCPAMLGFLACGRTHFARCARYVQTSGHKSDHEARCARGQEPCASRRRTRHCARTPPVALRATVVVFDVRHTTTASRPEGGTASGRLCAAEERRPCGRARSALRDLTRRSCLSAVSAANAASSATGHMAEYRRAPSRSEGQHLEPRRRTALGPALTHRMRTLNFRNGPQADSRGIRTFHASRVARSAMGH